MISWFRFQSKYGLRAEGRARGLNLICLTVSRTRTCKPVENNYSRRMAKKASGAIGGASSTSPQSEKPAKKSGTRITRPSETRQKPSSLLDTRVVYCGDNLEQLAKLPDACVDLIYIDPPFNSNRNYEVFWGESKEKRAFEDRHENTKAWVKQYIPNSIQLVPTISKCKIFRDKHAAHRSIDKPLKGDDSHAQIIQAWGLSSVSGIGYSPKNGVSTIKTVEDLFDQNKLWCDHYVTFQMRGKGKEEFISFCLELEHPKILNEAFNLVEALVLKSP
jgi:16S rRNA G966 N2-methylase RsmD